MVRIITHGTLSRGRHAVAIGIGRADAHTGIVTQRGVLGFRALLRFRLRFHAETFRLTMQRLTPGSPAGLGATVQTGGIIADP
mgnify:CR=1 FL=1